MDEQEVTIRDLESSLQQSSLDADRRLTRVQQEYERKVQLLMRKLMEAEGGRTENGRTENGRLSGQFVDYIPTPNPVYESNADARFDGFHINRAILKLEMSQFLLPLQGIWARMSHQDSFTNLSKFATSQPLIGSPAHSRRTIFELDRITACIHRFC